MKRNAIRFGLAGALVIVAATVGLAGDPVPKRHEAEENGAAKSTSSTFATKIKFVNETGKTVKLFELDDRGFRGNAPKATLKEDKSQGFSTFLTHPWLVTDKNEDAIAIYYPDTEPRTVVLK